MEYQTIIYEVKNQIAFVTFNRPESMNAVNRQMARDLVDACKQIEDDNAIRIAIFTGAGDRAFSAGMDLKERAESGSSPIERRQQKLSATIHTQSRAVAAITKPTIARSAAIASAAALSSLWPATCGWRRKTPSWDLRK